MRRASEHVRTRLIGGAIGASKSSARLASFVPQRAFVQHTRVCWPALPSLPARCFFASLTIFARAVCALLVARACGIIFPSRRARHDPRP